MRRFSWFRRFSKIALVLALVSLATCSFFIPKGVVAIASYSTSISVYPDYIERTQANENDATLYDVKDSETWVSVEVDPSAVDFDQTIVVTVSAGDVPEGAEILTDLGWTGDDPDFTGTGSFEKKVTGYWGGLYDITTKVVLNGEVIAEDSTTLRIYDPETTVTVEPSEVEQGDEITITVTASHIPDEGDGVLVIHPVGSSSYPGRFTFGEGTSTFNWRVPDDAQTGEWEAEASVQGYNPDETTFTYPRGRSQDTFTVEESLNPWVNVNARPDTVERGGDVVIDVSAGDVPEGAQVITDVIDPSGNVEETYSGTGLFMFDVPFNAPTGIWTVESRIERGTTVYDSDEDTFTVEEPQPTVSIDVVQDQAYQGDTIDMVVSAQNMPSGASGSVYLQSPSGTEYLVGAFQGDGSTTYHYTLPEDAEVGTWSAVAEIEQDGDVIAEDVDGFNVLQQQSPPQEPWIDVAVTPDTIELGESVTITVDAGNVPDGATVRTDVWHGGVIVESYYGTGTFLYTPDSGGSYNVHSFIQDNEILAEDYASFTVEEPIEVWLTGPDSGYRCNSYTFRAHASNLDEVSSVEIEVRKGGKVVASADDWSLTWTPDAGDDMGTYTVEATFQTDSGTEYASKSFELINRQPEVQIALPSGELYPGVEVTVPISASDDRGIVQISITVLKDGELYAVFLHNYGEDFPDPPPNPPDNYVIRHSDQVEMEVQDEFTLTLDEPGTYLFMGGAMDDENTANSVQGSITVNNQIVPVLELEFPEKVYVGDSISIAVRLMHEGQCISGLEVRVYVDNDVHICNSGESITIMATRTGTIDVSAEFEGNDHYEPAHNGGGLIEVWTRPTITIEYVGPKD